MRRFSYWFLFSLVAIPWAMSLVFLVLNLFGVSPPQSSFIFRSLLSFGSMTPDFLGRMTPQTLALILNYLLLFFVLRRFWLLFVKHEGVPDSYRGIVKSIGYLAIALFLFSVSIWIATFAIKDVGSGVPAALAMIPAMIGVPWALFITELLSFRKKVVS